MSTDPEFEASSKHSWCQAVKVEVGQAEQLEPLWCAQEGFVECFTHLRCKADESTQQYPSGVALIGSDSATSSPAEECESDLSPGADCAGPWACPLLPDLVEHSFAAHAGAPRCVSRAQRTTLEVCLPCYHKSQTQPQPRSIHQQHSQVVCKRLASTGFWQSRMRIILQVRMPCQQL